MSEIKRMNCVNILLESLPLEIAQLLRARAHNIIRRRDVGCLGPRPFNTQVSK